MRKNKDKRNFNQAYKNKIMFVVENILLILLSLILGFVIFGLCFCINHWPDIDVPQLMFNLFAPLKGTSNGLKIKATLLISIPMILLSGVIAVVLFTLKEKKKRSVAKVTMFSVSGFLTVITLICAFDWLDLINYISLNSKQSTYIQDNYAEPRKVKLAFPDKKRNLLYIYLESTEVTFTDFEHGGAKEQNLIPELTELAIENEDFSGNDEKLNGISVLPGIKWTAASMFASTSGLPLIIGKEDEKAIKEAEGSKDEITYFPNIMTLGDILKINGYTNELLIGSDAKFAARELYFSKHGNYLMHDYYYAKENLFESHGIEKNHYVNWGYEDKHLFEFAKEELIEYSKADKPFNLTMLTVDTHFEDGYVCDDCIEYYDDQYSNVYRCSSKKVSDFLQWFRHSDEIPQDVVENTTIVLTGDHPTMDSDFCDDVDPEYQRKSYVCYINSAVKASDKSLRREYSAMDHFPTTLASLGVRIDGDRLGLGTNLFSTVPTLIESSSLKDVKDEFLKTSKFLKDLQYGKK